MKNILIAVVILLICKDVPAVSKTASNTKDVSVTIRFTATILDTSTMSLQVKDIGNGNKSVSYAYITTGPFATNTKGIVFLSGKGVAIFRGLSDDIIVEVPDTMVALHIPDSLNWEYANK